jgi:syringomycin synthetase protein SyrE
VDAVNSLSGEAAWLPFSVSQREVWLDQRAWPGSTHLFIGGVAYLNGALDVEILTAALQLLVAESDALRLVPQEKGTQTLLRDLRVPFEITHAQHETDLHQATQAWWMQQLQTSYVWDGTPPWRFCLIRGTPGHHALVMQYHHLVMDGWGTARLIQRWSEIYKLLHAGQAVIPSTAASYRSFIEDSNTYAQSAGFKSDADYWLEQMPSLQPVLIDKVHAGGDDNAMRLPEAVLGNMSLPLADYEQLKARAAESGSTVFNYFLAAMAVYFARVSNRSTVVIGVPNLNRSGRKYRDTLGMFVGVFPVQVTLLADMTVQALLASIAATMRGALRHTRYPLSEMGRGLDLMRQCRDGIFDVLLSFERQDYDVAFGEARMSESRQLFNGKARYPLGVTVCEFQSAQDPELVLEGSSACFEAHEIAQVGQRIWGLVLRMMAAPDLAVDALPLLSQAQFDRLQALQRRNVWHDNATPYIAQFDDCAWHTPHATALVWDGGSMAYAELQRRANQFAQRLIALGAGPDKVVALAVPRSPELVIALLAVSKAGAAFLPLDPDAPTARLADIVQESGALALVIQAEAKQRLSSLHTTVLVASSTEDLTEDADRPPALEVSPTSLAYVLFTSGSTGRPKGVMVEHAALAHRLRWLSNAYGITPADRSALSTQITFDPSLIELCLPLINGASVALPPPGRLLPETLADAVIRHGATFIATVPSTLARLLDRAAGNPDLKLRVACCGGDVLPAEVVNRYLSRTKARLFNVYGPTEACIFATAWECVSSANDAVLPIGFPVDDACIYVLDAKCLQLPLGMPGEIYIGGPGLARGYLGRADLDQQVFLPDPFKPGARMYRTGDTGWLDEEGNLHFVGRLDRQVKLRGYRIELGEIEAALMRVPGVGDAAVKLVQKHDKPALHAWVASATALGAADLQKTLRMRLPDYMVPSGISVLAELPFSSTGKIDYEALQLPTDNYVAQVTREPKNALERSLLGLWEHILQVQPLGVDDNFFEVGGDSLDAVTLLADLEKIVAGPVPLFLLIENPTVEQLAQALESPIKAPSSMVRFSPASNKPPMYIAASGYGDLMRFETLAHALSDTYDVRMLQPPTGESIGSIAKLASFYADLIAAQGDVPGFVAGFSVGGIAALETARALRQRQIPLLGLIFLDTLYPRAMWGGTTFWRLFVWLVKNYRLGDMLMNGRRLGTMISDAALVGQVTAMAGYRAHPFDGRTILINTTALARWDWLFFSPWRRLQKDRLEVRTIPGLHGSIFEDDQVAELARALRETTK